MGPAETRLTLGDDDDDDDGAKDDHAWDGDISYSARSVDRIINFLIVAKVSRFI